MGKMDQRQNLYKEA